MWKTAVTGILLWVCSVASGFAQHMYLDVNGDGKATELDILGPDQSVDLWIETDRNRDGSSPAAAACSGRQSWSRFAASTGCAFTNSGSIWSVWRHCAIAPS